MKKTENSTSSTRTLPYADSLCAVVLANVLALLPTVVLTGDPHHRVWTGSPQDLCDRLASSSFAAAGVGLEFFFGCTALCHAIHKYKTILEKKVGMWQVQYSLHTKDKVPAFGDLPERSVRYTLTITQSGVNNTDTSINTLIHTRNTKLHAILNQKYGADTCLFGGCTSLMALLSPGTFLALLDGMRGLLPQANDDAVAHAAEQEKHPGVAGAGGAKGAKKAGSKKRAASAGSDDVPAPAARVSLMSVSTQTADVSAVVHAVEVQTEDVEGGVVICPQASPTTASSTHHSSHSSPLTKTEHAGEIKITTDKSKRSIVDIQQDESLSHRDRIAQGRSMYSEECAKFCMKLKAEKKDTAQYYIDKVKHTSDKGKAETVKVQKWLIKHTTDLDRLVAASNAGASPDSAPTQTTLPPPAVPPSDRDTQSAPAQTSSARRRTPGATRLPPAPPAPPPPPSFTLAQALQWGKTRIKTEVEPKYHQYLQKEKNKANRAQQQQQQHGGGAEGGVPAAPDADTQQLNKFNLPVLKAYLVSKQERCSAWPKAQVVTCVIQKYGKIPFQRFVAENNIHNDEAAKAYMQGLKRTQEIVEHQTRTRHRQEMDADVDEENL